MALHSTVVAACELLEARSTTGGHRLAALNWWVQLSNVTRAVHGLNGDPLAGLTETQVAEVRTVMLLARQLLVTDDLTSMLTFGVTRSAQFWINVTANFRAFVLLAIFSLVTNALTFESINQCYLL